MIIGSFSFNVHIFQKYFRLNYLKRRKLFILNYRFISFNLYDVIQR